MILHTDYFLRAKFTQRHKHFFFVDSSDQKFVLFQNLLGCVHCYSSPHFIWTNSWLDWRILFVKLHTDTVLSAKFDNDMSTLFVDDLDQKFLLFKNLLWFVHSYSSPPFNWTGSWLDGRTHFLKLHTDTFLSAKFDNDMSSFFVDKPDQKFLLFKNFLGCIHSQSNPHFIWTSPWIDWRKLYVKLHTDSFLSAKFVNNISKFFLENPDGKFFLFQSPMWRLHSYSSPHFNWTSCWLDWRTFFVKLHTDTFLSAKFDNDMSSFFVDKPDQNFLRFKNLLDCIHSQSIPLFNWTSPWLDWRKLYVKLHTDTFLSAKFGNNISKFFLDNPDGKFFPFQSLLWRLHFYSSPRFNWTSW